MSSPTRPHREERTKSASRRTRAAPILRDALHASRLLPTCAFNVDLGQARDQCNAPQDEAERQRMPTTHLVVPAQAGTHTPWPIEETPIRASVTDIVFMGPRLRGADSGACCEMPPHSAHPGEGRDPGLSLRDWCLWLWVPFFAGTNGERAWCPPRNDSGLPQQGTFRD